MKDELLKGKSILVVDDEESICEFLGIMLRHEGCKVKTLQSAKKALDLFEKEKFDVVITDISMPEMSGIDLLAKIKQVQTDVAVIIMTAFGSTESAVEAMKLGAADYLTKPFQIDEMKLSIQNAIHAISLEKENRNLRSELGKTYSLDNIVGNSAKMHEVFEMVKRVSQTKTNIMILGPSGTGKELIAHAIHRNSAEPESPFVVINCAAIPEQLLESELFGHKKGSFTGAVSDKKGLFELANGGTLFLDEVGDIPLPFQVKILRAIQQKNFRAVGGTEDISVSVRLLCATHKNLELAITKGEFREDLYYRLNVIQIQLPSLKERREDIPLLANHFLSKYNLAMGKFIKTISKEAMELLVSHDYPGNVRELENIIERAVALETQSAIFPESLPAKLSGNSHKMISIEQIDGNRGAADEKLQPNFNLEKGVEDYERQYIIKALEQVNGVKKRAAELLGISFRSLRYRIEKYGIEDTNPDESE